jgi:hypothetical protein
MSQKSLTLLRHLLLFEVRKIFCVLFVTSTWGIFFYNISGFNIFDKIEMKLNGAVEGEEF